MKFVLFGEQNPRVGLLEGTRILDLAQAAKSIGLDSALQTSFQTLIGLIESGRRGLDAVSALAEKLRNSDEAGIWSAAATARLHAPWPGQRFLLAGSNNASHLAEAFSHMGDALSVEEARIKGRKAVPSGFWGASRPIMGPNANIQIPGRAKGYFDYEGEPGIILGQRGKNIRSSEIRDYVWGVTLVADWSIRIPEWPPKPNAPFMPVKNFDCSKSIGPVIAVDEVEPQSIQIETIVNGKRRQYFNSSEMIYSFGEILEYFSQDFSFFPGDVVSGGTGSGTAVDQTTPRPDGSWPTELFLRPGDIVEHRSDPIGALVSRIVA